MRRSRYWYPSVLFACLTILASTRPISAARDGSTQEPAPAQSPDPGPSPSPAATPAAVFPAQVELVTVDVVVREKKGELLTDLAREGKVRYEIRPVTEAEVRSADEIWLTSSTKEVLAVTTLDGKPVGNGVPGPAFRRMHALYQDYNARLAAAPEAA